MVRTDSAPLLPVFHLQAADVNTEVVDESYIRWPYWSHAVSKLCFCECNAIVGFTLIHHP